VKLGYGLENLNAGSYPFEAAAAFAGLCLARGDGIRLLFEAYHVAPGTWRVLDRKREFTITGLSIRVCAFEK
jgi:hypothetical protein